MTEDQDERPTTDNLNSSFSWHEWKERFLNTKIARLADSDEQLTASIPEAAWGASVAEERAAFLAARLQMLKAIAIGENATPPFSDVELSGADVFWLVCELLTGAKPDFRGMLRIRRLNAEEFEVTTPTDAVFDRQTVENSLRAIQAVLLAFPRDTVALDDESRVVLMTFLEGVGVPNLVLTGANLGAAQLSGAFLAEAHLEYASLDRAWLQGAYLRDAHLEGAQLGGARLQAASLERAKLDGANLRKSHIQAALMTRASLTASALTEAHLEGADLVEADLSGADLTNASLYAANLARTDLRRARLSGAHLAGASLLESRLQGAVLAEQDTLSAEFGNGGDDPRRAQPWHRLHVEGTQLQGTAFDTAMVEQMREWLPQFPNHLPPADLRLAELDSETKLKGAVVGDRERGAISVADVSWNDCSLAGIDWEALELNDDRAAKRVTRSYVRSLPEEQRATAKRERITKLRAAVRANTQLSAVLRSQGLIEISDDYTYRAQSLQRRLYWYEHKPLKYLLSRTIATLVGYGYKPLNVVLWYLAIVLAFGALAFALAPTSLHWNIIESLVFSVTSFHGRGFFPGTLALDSPLIVVAAVEAVIGLIIEIFVVASFTQRFLSTH